MAKAKEILSVPVSEIDDRPELNHRKSVGDLEDLQTSIAERGVLVPLQIVKAKGEKPWRLVAGFRRMAAVKALKKREVPCIAVEAKTEADILLLSLAENMPRRSLTPMDEARAFFALQKEGVQLSKVAKVVGVKLDYVERRLKLLKFSEPLQQALEDEVLGVASAELINRLPKDRHEKFIGIAKDLPVEALRAQVKKEMDRIKRAADYEPPEPSKNAPDEDAEKMEKAAAKGRQEMRRKLRVHVMDAAREYAPSLVDDAAILDYGALSDEAVRVFLGVIERVPISDANRTAKDAQGKDVPREPVVDLGENTTFPKEPVFYGGEKGKAAALFKKAAKKIHKTNLPELTTRLQEIAWERAGKGPKDQVKVTQGDVQSWANEIGVEL